MVKLQNLSNFYARSRAHVCRSGLKAVWSSRSCAMGQPLSCCCENTEDDRNLPLQPLEMDGAHGAADSLVVVKGKADAPKDVSFWDQLEGVYCRKEDSKFMAKIQGNVLTWAPDFRSDPSELSVSGGKQISMSIGGTLYTAEVNPKGGELTWNDGEIWVRK
eukprot:s1711_g7.t1